MSIRFILGFNCSAHELLGLTRGYGEIEINLHSVSNVTFCEDATQITKGSAPRVTAILRRIVVFVFKRLEHKNAATVRRHHV